jgi:hypothetical protein
MLPIYLVGLESFRFRNLVFLFSGSCGLWGI